jgi:hypothetical protein
VVGPVEPHAAERGTNRGVRLRLGLLAVAALVSGCSQATGSSSHPSPTPTRPAGNVAVLIARPMTLPVVQPGTTCPVTPIATVTAGVSDPRGRGPFYLGGPLPTGAFPWNKMVYIVAGTTMPGPILFRGARIDGVGRLRFSGDRVTASDVGTLLTSDGGVSDIFYDRALHDSNGGALFVFPSTKGCYAMQVDAPTFEDVIVVSAA